MGEREQVELCKPCAVARSRSGVRLKTVSGRSDKITCADCGRRRYGQTYEVAPTTTKEDTEK